MAQSASTSPAKAPPVPVTRVSTAEGFAVGALAAMTAVTCTNPMEVMKTRMQLQGELMETSKRKAGGGPAPPRLYNNALDCFAKTLRSEGIRGVQRGLSAAYIYQVLLNGSRLGFYEPFRVGFNSLAGKQPDEVWAAGALLAGASSGVVGAMFGNAFFLVKARQQAYSPHHVIGKASHNYSGLFNGLTSIVKTEGLLGLARGMDASMLRTAMGSTVQLPAYNWMKTYLIKLDPNTPVYQNPLALFAGKPNSFGTYLVSSIFSGLCVCAVMQPADTALTRMYNQPTIKNAQGKTIGALYRNPIHCLYLTARAEGVLGWYKGTTAHLLRIAPHTVLTLVVNEAYLRYWTNFKAGRSILAAPPTKDVA
ncbi:Mitochondrial oxaloacetate carrier protein [Tilletia horrida]|uniref:Mitochondrial oxaloacetate carrier protein n=1 Tax=Tilletia horrida TaxID=155126 RepID=A0AAN6GZE8_9BASI|nr:Mitochondrial oxaloacetate carrier protein [Tilletia horrida]KAK0569367.1 Mitochondrial oxaloacetate carrier protein [Tilletia horrida]